MLNHPCILGISTTWSWYIILFVCCWVWFAGIFSKIFASLFTGNLVCHFPVIALSAFGVRVILASWNVN